MKGTRSCAWCDHAFEWHPKIRTTYCSRSCRGFSVNEGKACELRWKRCRECEQPHLRKAAKFCSASCSRSANRRAMDERYRRLNPAVDRVCPECTTQFTCGPNEPRTAAAVFCSDRCWRRYTKRERIHLLRARRQGRKEWISIGIVGTRDGWHCHLCRKQVRRVDASIDHHIPLSFGGTHTLDNVSLAHHACNARRSNTGAAQLRLIA